MKTSETEDHIKDFDSGIVYHGNNLVTVTGKDAVGVTWVITMNYDSFDNAMKEAANKL